MVVYLLGSEKGEYGLELALKDPDSLIVLIQDATFLPFKKQDAFGKSSRLLALHEHVEKRGLLGRIPESIRLIHFEEFVDLIISNKAINFL
ncbi:MAG: hypothetical protein A2161_12435 [Candidatus Schekmanbacteria bacterium RBG_13_48_7]|uniref:Sulfurtransferase complex subunit TusB n=1 Tax=Candidatus Schekmanbacteria bacterium RBG_13_48_7 TaxID=1817878 RepID=A0A1F7RM37_9BACT|nr:MAG: hypothetical protein A2161_12435 [Candidatus Schekmanbacteria bacterium RBG_13_48_7]